MLRVLHLQSNPTIPSLYISLISLSLSRVCSPASPMMSGTITAAANRRLRTVLSRLGAGRDDRRRLRRCVTTGKAGSAGPGLDLYYSPTPNGWKVSIMLEECGADYRTVFLDLARGDQFKPEFLKISPNNRMPAIVDHEGDGESVSVFESGACLLYLGRKYGKFLPPESEPRARKEVEEWLFWQVGGLGPMAGQLSHFLNYAPFVDENADHAYATERYRGEYERLLAVMDQRLSVEPYLAAGEYTVADMACFGWVLAYKNFKVDISSFPNVKRWYDELKVRPALRRGVNLGKQPKPISSTLVESSEESIRRLFQQGKTTVKGE